MEKRSGQGDVNLQHVSATAGGTWRRQHKTELAGDKCSMYYTESDKSTVRYNCYIWYSEEGPGRAGAPLSSLLAVPDM